MLIEQSTRILFLLTLGTLISQVGCDYDRVERIVTAEEVVAEIERLGRAVHPMPPGSTDAAFHALNSGEPTMRAEAAMSLGKSQRLTRSITKQLEQLAYHDADPIVRAAALSALLKHGPPSSEICELLEILHSDSQLSMLASQLSTEK